MPAEGPLHDIRVLDIATFIAAPFCGTVLADFGADVIKIEQPGEGDPLRRFGTPTECGDSFVWLSEARNKSSVTLDLRTEQGAALFLQLAAKSDVILENFRPGTLEKWGLGYDALKAVNPRIVVLRISAYGQTGPYRSKPGFARIAHAFSGLSYLAGEAGRQPVMPGSTSLADYMSGLWGAVGVLIAQREAERSGVGQVIDLGLYESVFRVLDEIAPVYAKHDFVRERMGADTVNVVPHSHYQTGDGRWIALACSSDKMFVRLAQAMCRPELATMQEYSTMAARIARRAEVNGIVADWVARLTMEELMKACDEVGVPCGPLNNIADIFRDPQYAARGNLQTVPSRAGEIVVPAAVPHMSATPPAFRHAGPALGADTDRILSEVLGLDAPAVAALRAAEII
jgi:crotonobetainyl-CoA:carnitine CoA-transferase CaiB-like acyl-CoA transferase